jgi:hypothetical protein
MTQTLSKPLKAVLERYRDRSAAPIPESVVEEILELIGKNPDAAVELGPQAHVFLRARIHLLATREIIRIGKKPDIEESDLTHKLLVESIHDYFRAK